MQRRRIALIALIVTSLLTLLAVQGSADAKKKPPHKAKKHHVKKKPKPKPKPLTAAQKLAKIKHIVVIYEENHSFDNLYGGWEGVRGRTAADTTHTTQVNQSGTPFQCLMQL